MYDRGVLQRRAYHGKDLRHRRFADDVFRPDAMDSDVYWVKLVFRVDEDRQRFEHFARSEMNKSDRTDAAKVNPGRCVCLWAYDIATFLLAVLLINKRESLCF